MAGQGEEFLDSQAVFAGVLCEFLEVAFHLILYIRDIYPAIVFERRKKFNVPVQNHQPVERFVFEVNQPAQLSLSNDELLLNTESALRAFLLKINISDSILKPNPQGCTFAVLATTKQSSHIRLQNTKKGEMQLYVEENTDLKTESKPEDENTT